MFFDKNSKNKIWVTDIWRDYLPCVLYTIHMYLLHLLQFGLPYIHGYKKRTSKQSQWRIPITTLITSLWCRQASKQASKQASEWAWASCQASGSFTCHVAWHEPERWSSWGGHKNSFRGSPPSPRCMKEPCNQDSSFNSLSHSIFWI